ncbi:MAG: pyridoxal phosphate-dependent aminotransferase [Methanomassiliicoccales archaeon]
MKLEVSDRSQMTVQSEIRNMTLECFRVGGINLAQGVCDLDAPNVIIEAACKAMKDGHNQYTRYDGLPVLRKAIAGKLKHFNSLDVDPEKEIVVSAGATALFHCACMALLNEGDEVIVPEPFYGYHVNTILAVGGRPVFVRLDAPDWKLDVDRLEAAVTARTKAIIVNTPVNPTGKVFSKAELKLIADFATEHDLFVFTDEIYEYFVFDGRKHISPASLGGMAERTIAISGYSKTFSITGWRIGYCWCDARWARRIGYVNDLIYVCAPAPLQIGVAKGIETLPDSYYENIMLEYQGKRELMCQTLRPIGMEPYSPEGAYYVLADVSSVPGKNSKERAMQILDRTGVACVPGSAFYHDDAGESMVRFCFAKKDDVLKEACKRLSEY